MFWQIELMNLFNEGEHKVISARTEPDPKTKKNRVRVETQASQEYKYSIRDNIVKQKLKLTVLNMPNTYVFYIVSSTPESDVEVEIEEALKKYKEELPTSIPSRVVPSFFSVLSNNEPPSLNFDRNASMNHYLESQAVRPYSYHANAAPTSKPRSENSIKQIASQTVANTARSDLSTTQPNMLGLYSTSEATTQFIAQIQNFITKLNVESNEETNIVLHYALTNTFNKLPSDLKESFYVFMDPAPAWAESERVLSEFKMISQFDQLAKENPDNIVLCVQMSGKYINPKGDEKELKDFLSKDIFESRVTFKHIPSEDIYEYFAVSFPKNLAIKIAKIYFSTFNIDGYQSRKNILGSLIQFFAKENSFEVVSKEQHLFDEFKLTLPKQFGIKIDDQYLTCDGAVSPSAIRQLTHYMFPMFPNLQERLDKKIELLQTTKITIPEKKKFTKPMDNDSLTKFLRSHFYLYYGKQMENLKFNDKDNAFMVTFETATVLGPSMRINLESHIQALEDCIKIYAEDTPPIKLTESHVGVGITKIYTITIPRESALQIYSEQTEPLKKQEEDLYALYTFLTLLLNIYLEKTHIVAVFLPLYKIETQEWTARLTFLSTRDEVLKPISLSDAAQLYRDITPNIGGLNKLIKHDDDLFPIRFIIPPYEFIESLGWIKGGGLPWQEVFELTDLIFLRNLRVNAANYLQNTNATSARFLPAPIGRSEIKSSQESKPADEIRTNSYLP